MELGIHFVNFNLPGGTQALGPTLAATARAAEQGGATMFTLTSFYEGDIPCCPNVTVPTDDIDGLWAETGPQPPNWRVIVHMNT
jgi:hypothetical protein